MNWIELKRKKPDSYRKVWITYIVDGVLTEQKQTYAKVVGKDDDNNILWHDFVTGQLLDIKKVTITHWMYIPKNPMLTKQHLN